MVFEDLASVKRGSGEFSEDEDAFAGDAGPEGAEFGVVHGAHIHEGGAGVEGVAGVDIFFEAFEGAVGLEALAAGGEEEMDVEEGVFEGDAAGEVAGDDGGFGAGDGVAADGFAEVIPEADFGVEGGSDGFGPEVMAGVAGEEVCGAALFAEEDALFGEGGEGEHGAAVAETAGALDVAAAEGFGGVVDDPQDGEVTVFAEDAGQALHRVGSGFGGVGGGCGCGGGGGGAVAAGGDEGLDVDADEDEGDDGGGPEGDDFVEFFAVGMGFHGDDAHEGSEEEDQSAGQGDVHEEFAFLGAAGAFPAAVDDGEAEDEREGGGDVFEGGDGIGDESEQGEQGA